MSVGAGQGHEVEMEGLGASPQAATFGKYHLFASLGRGGMADVFLSVARGPMGFNKLAVIKRLRANLADDPAFRTMFLDEARLAARLNHPNVVHTYEVGEQDGSYFIAMEYLEGQSLNKVIREAVKRNDVFDQAFCARMVSDALAGLHCAHELRDYDGRPLNIIHRDVSPHNVFVTYGGQVKLVDFGIAKAALSSTETEVGVLKGKVAYMAPEQAMGGPIDCRADIFSMGIVLWELLARQRLMTGDSAASTLHRLLNAPIPSILSVRDDVDPELEAIVARALEKDPRYRFNSAQEMRDALDGFLMSTGRNVRQDEIGHKISEMFEDVRAEVQAQVQAHMSTVHVATSTHELEALNAEGIRRFNPGQSGAEARVGGTGSNGHLLKLGVGSGSGSGVVPNFGGYSASEGASIPPRADVTAEQKKSRLIIGVLAAVASVLTVAVIVMLVVGMRRDPASPHAGTQVSEGEPTATASEPTAPSFPAVPPGPSPTGAVIAQGGSGPVVVQPAAGGVAPTVNPAPVPQPVQPQPTTPQTAGRNPATGGKPARPGTHGASHPTTAVAPAQDKTPDKAEDGFLTLDTYPWTKVTEGSRNLGTTPLNRVSLSPGVHSITMENPEKGIKQTVPITIKSGEVVAKKLAFE
jgi:serine/threonine protein kinase